MLHTRILIINIIRLVGNNIINVIRELPARFTPLALLVKSVPRTALFHTVVTCIV